MIEMFGDAWELSKGKILCITTNGIVNQNGLAIMGRGIAKEAADKFPELREVIGESLGIEGNHVFSFGVWDDWHIVTFPTKNHWREKSDTNLIKRSTKELLQLANGGDFRLTNRDIYLPRPGCSNGGLDWKEVKPLLFELDHRFYIVAREEER